MVLADETSKKKLRKTKRKNGKIISEVIDEPDTLHSNEGEGRISKRAEDKLQKSRKKKRKNDGNVNNIDEFNEKDERISKRADDKLQKSRRKKRKNVGNIDKIDEFNEKDDGSEHQTESKHEDHMASSGELDKGDTRKRKSKTGKSKKGGKMKRKNQSVANEVSPDILPETREEDAEDEAYHMSSGDEDYSKGMKKWITQYHQSRPGLKVLQERIDDFIMDHEAKEEKARIEREAQAAEDGWTVVVHHKGRKKTTDAESGIAVGSVAQAAVLDKMTKKKKKEVGLDFYRFQKREAHRNEIMMLQSKFEQDKKRIQQMRAARKFRPY